MPRLVASHFMILRVIVHSLTPGKVKTKKETNEQTKKRTNKETNEQINTWTNEQTNKHLFH